MNGNFEDTSLGTSYQISRPGVTGTTITGWTNAGYSFLFLPGTADTTGARSPEWNFNLKLWGPGTGSANGLPATSPVGGNFIGADGDYVAEALSQTVSNLNIGENYKLTFYWAAAQQAGYNGVTTENWGVTFGSQTFRTATVTTPNHGFTPWKQETVYFTATATSQVLSFFAKGTPSGVPPFSLLDGVSLVAAPEPATWAVMMIGLGGVTFLLRRRRRNANRDDGPALAA